MRDGEPDFSKYTAEQIGRALSRIDREKFPLNYANLLAAQQALPDLPMDSASIVERERVRLQEAVASGNLWLSMPAFLTFWLPCLSRAVVRGRNLEIRGHFARRTNSLSEIVRVRWNDAPTGQDKTLAVIEFRSASPIKVLPVSSDVMRAFAEYVGVVQGGTDVADPKYVSVFSIGPADP